MSESSLGACLLGVGLFTRAAWQHNGGVQQLRGRHQGGRGAELNKDSHQALIILNLVSLKHHSSLVVVL